MSTEVPKFRRMEGNNRRHSNPPPSNLSPSPPPSLSRTRSGSSSRSLPAATHTTAVSAASGRPIQRSQSTARPRTKGKDQLNNSISQSFHKSTSNRDLQLDNHYNNKNEQTYGKKTKSNSPSAWALSPGRFPTSTPPPMVPKSPNSYSLASSLFFTCFDRSR